MMSERDCADLGVSGDRVTWEVSKGFWRDWSAHWVRPTNERNAGSPDELAAGTCPRLDHHRLAPGLLQMLGDDAGEQVRLGPTMILIGRLGKISVAAAKAGGRTVSASARPAILAVRNSPKALLPARGLPRLPRARHDN